jgi:hypothetical protein
MRPDAGVRIGVPIGVLIVKPHLDAVATRANESLEGLSQDAGHYCLRRSGRCNY